MTPKRKCSHCGQPMSEGYVIDGGDEYYCSDECLYEHYTPQQYKEMYGDGDGDTYWSQFDD